MKTMAKHTIPAAHRATEELREALSPQDFAKVEDILRYVRQTENMQFQLAWRYGQEGKTFDEFMASFTKQVPFVNWGNKI